MISIKKGKVTKILRRLEGRTDILVNINNKNEKSINYDYLTGNINIDDEVILNTTAVELSLGTGGYHFVICNLNNNKNVEGSGHIMKLRYTPFQIKTYSVEEQESDYHKVFNEFKSLDNMPIIVGTLHSMLTPIAATLKYLNENIKIGFIMTDGAALPIYLSNTVYELKQKNIIYKTITIGNAFGGDYEAINIYSALITAKEIAKCDIVIVTMGPGIVGTGTQYGFTGIEQAYMADAVNDLEGIPICVPRVTFKDKRKRHYGLSHHSLTVFKDIAKTRYNIVFPYLHEQSFIKNQIKEGKLNKKHNIIYIEEDILSQVLKKYDLKVKSMGRSFIDDPEFFKTCSVASIYANYLLNDH